MGQPNPTTTDAAIASCDLEPISWEYAPVKHHDTVCAAGLLAESETVSEPVRVTPDKLAVAGFRFFAVAA